MLSISMVLPAYNEERNIRRSVSSADAALAAVTPDYEIIVVNDGSSDQTGIILAELVAECPRLRVIEQRPNRGYGGALRAGFAAATHEWIFQSDSDNQFEYGELSSLIALAPSHDFVIGYRQPRRDPLVRRLNGWGWNLLIRLVCGYVVRDIDCAFRLFRRSALDAVPLTSNGAMISTELLVGAKARGYRMAEVRVTHLPRVGGQPTGAHPTVILCAFRDLLRYRVELSRQLRLERPQHAVRA
jgi:glycosyltransferase involved in cell wall biosynthesis